jgi:signal transduction histidine kinase
MSSAPPEPASPPAGVYGLRLALWYAGLFVASGLGLALLAYALLAGSLAERDRELVLQAARQYVSEYAAGGLAAVRDAVAADRIAGRREGLFVRILGPGAEALFASVPSSWAGIDLRALAPPEAGTAPGWTELPGPGAVFEVASLRLADGTLVQVGKSSEARADILARFRARAALVLASSLLLAALGGVALARFSLAPLRRLHAAFLAIVRTGGVAGRVPVRGDGDPLDDLSRLFNEMLDRIEALIAGLKGSLDNVAHDLRTPLARLRATLEAGLGRESDPEALRRALAAGLEETDRLSSTLTSLMDISEAETGTLSLRLERLDAGAVLRESAELYEDAAEEKPLALDADPPSGLAVVADRVRLRQALANLLDNALKYTPAGGHVRLRVFQEGGETVFECADDGPGIAPYDLPRIWDRLYRGDSSRSERGLGLGLSLVRAIARAHGGEAEVVSAPGAGARFRLRLPAAATITDLSSAGKARVSRRS